VTDHVRGAILRDISAAIDKINAGNVTDDQKAAMSGLKGIKVVDDTKRTGTGGGIFQIKQYRVQHSTLDGLTADIIHDSFHPDQGQV
jgi:hypothetical protein